MPRGRKANHDAILAANMAGEPQAAIARKHGLTRQAVNEIVAKAKRDTILAPVMQHYRQTNDWRTQLAGQAVSAMQQGLTAPDADPVARGRLGVQVATGLGVLQPAAGAITVIMQSMPTALRADFAAADDEPGEPSE